jgi:hypothetical protein
MMIDIFSVAETTPHFLVSSCGGGRLKGFKNMPVMPNKPFLREHAVGVVALNRPQSPPAVWHMHVPER